MELLQGHSFAGHPAGLHEVSAGWHREQVALGPEPVGSVALRLGGRHRQAVEHHHAAGHAAVGQIRLGFVPLHQRRVVRPTGARLQQQFLTGRRVHRDRCCRGVDGSHRLENGQRHQAEAQAGYRPPAVGVLVISH